jgi:Pyruvate/2-oxoacid:ferredoxin oxidoreductase delta subunit
MDGVLMMEGNGPASGKAKVMEVLMLSDDPVALDASFARMIDLDPDYVPTIKYGHEMGLGNKDPENILLLGDDASLFFDPEFDVVRKPVDTDERSKLANFGKLKGLLLQKPVVDKDKCIGCGICQEACPLEKKAIKMVTRTRRTYPLYLYHHCIRCYCCQEMCPEGAISVKTPLLGKLLI